MKLFSGSSNLPLAEKVAKLLGVTLGDCELKRFPDGECKVWVKEDVKNQEIFILQSLSYVADQNLMELCLFGDALKRLGAKTITAIIPWMGYSKQDKEFRKGEAVSAQLVAKFLECAGFDKVITIDLHSNKIKDYFTIPVAELSARELLGKEIQRCHSEAKSRRISTRSFTEFTLSETNVFRMTDIIVISPDKGGVGRSEKFAKDTGLPVAHLDKTRDLETGKVIINGIDHVISGKECIIFDDIINTGGTALETAKFLHDKGVSKIIFLATHAVLAGEASKKLQASFINEIIVSDTINILQENFFPKLKIVSVADMIAQKIIDKVVIARSPAFGGVNSVTKQSI